MWRASSHAARRSASCRVGFELKAQKTRIFYEAAEIQVGVMRRGGRRVAESFRSASRGVDGVASRRDWGST